MKLRPNLLIVDDLRENVQLLEALICEINANQIHAFSGAEALEKTRGVELALAIIDVRMPEMNGYELALKINEERNQEKVPVIFLTAINNNELEQFKGYNSGAVDYLFKPFENNILLSKINVFIDLFNQKQTIIEESKLLKQTTDELIRVNGALHKSEQKYRSYIDNAPDGVLVTDETRKFLEVNQAACRITGYSQKQLLEMTVLDLLFNESKEDGLAHFNKVTDFGASKIEMHFKHKTGSKHWWSVETVKLSENRFLSFIKDITTRIELKKFLKANQLELEMQNKELIKTKQIALNVAEKYTELYDFAPIGYFTLSKKNTIKSVNFSGARILGQTRSELMGKSFDAFISENTQATFNTFIKDVFEKKMKEICEVIIDSRGSQLKYVHIEGGVEGDGQQCILNVVDITERKHADDLINQIRRNYETFFNTINDFLFVLDKHGNIIHTNSTVLERLGYSKAELFGESILRLHLKEGIHETDQIINAILNGQISECTIPIVTKSGDQISVETKASHGLWNGEPAIFEVSQDISKIKLSEEKFSKVFYLNPSACGLSDLATGQYVEVNDAFQTLLGFDKAEVIGKTAVELGILTPKNLNSLLSKIKSEKTMINLETKLIAKNGDLKLVLLSAEDIHIQDNNFRFTVVHDITERKKAEQTLKVSEEKYKTMLNASPDGILLLDLNGRITEISEIGLEIFGTNKRDDLVGENILLFVPDDNKKLMTEIFEKTINDGLIQSIELNIRKINQTIFNCEASATLIQSIDGEPLSFMFIIRDVSHRKKMATKQIHADRMANLGEMASGIAHEINQPLNIISLVMDKILFETAKTGAVNVEFLKTKSDKIFENITRMRNIIDHIRAFSRSHEDYIPIAFNINTSIENAISMIKEQFKHLDITIDLQLEKQLPQILGNTYKFEQVIMNMLSNAKDAVIEKKNTQNENFEMYIKIKTYTENQFLIVEISDNGIGIGNEDINNIMLPFYTTKDDGKGTGLGLSICYQIIKEMNGVIDITSDKTNGAIIKLIINTQNKK